MDVDGWMNWFVSGLMNGWLGDGWVNELVSGL